MRKKVFGRQLSRGRKARIALIRSLIKALIVSGKISTTKAKVKTIQGQVDKLVKIAKKNSLSRRRQVLAILGNDRKVTDLFFLRLVPVFAKRESGFTRLILLPRRLGDSAEMASLEFVDKPLQEKPKKEIKKVIKKAKNENISA